MRSQVAQRILSETPQHIKDKVNMYAWWQTVDKKDLYLIQLYSGMFGTVEQRIAQLYIIRKAFNFKNK
jgi:hypothetical protein|nr:MAG TPA: hypothetical protein [Caudoviricetes sp.]